MTYPTRWCSQCKVDWPQHTSFNLCPKCGRNTKAATSDTPIDETAARVLAAKYKAFDAWLAGERTPSHKRWAAEMDALVAGTSPSPPHPRGRLAPQHWTDDLTPDGA